MKYACLTAALILRKGKTRKEPSLAVVYIKPTQVRKERSWLMSKPRVITKAKFEEKVNKKAEEKVDLVRSECRAQMNELRDQFTSVIINLLGKLKTTNLSSDFDGFNPFEGLSFFNDANEDSTYAVSKDESYSNDDNNSGVGAAVEGSGDDEEYSASGEKEINVE